MYQSSPSPAPRRSGHVYPSPFALLLLSLSPSIYISFSIHLPSILPARQPFPPPKLCPVLRGKLLRGASLFWLPYFTDSDRPPCLPRFLPFYPFSSSLSPRPPFHKLPRPSLSSWPAYRGPLSLYSRYILGPSCFIPSCVTLSLIQHVVPASETPRSSSSPISLATPGEQYFSRSLVRIRALISTCALPEKGRNFVYVCGLVSSID